MELSKMFGVDRGEWFKVLGFDCSLFRIIYDDFKMEELQIKYPEKILFEPVTINMMYAVISGAPSGIIHLPPPLTDEQKEQLRAIWTLGGRWLAKDKYCSVRYYRTKPCKGSIAWYAEDKMGYGLETYQFLGIWNLPAWDDLEPYDIGKALEIKR